LPCIKKVSVKKCHLAGPIEKLATTFLGALYGTLLRKWCKKCITISGILRLTHLMKLYSKLQALPEKRTSSAAALSEKEYKKIVEVF
jgi:hypothetical protein